MKELILIPIASLFAETITHPVDFIKTQKQYIKTSVPFYTLCLQTFQKNGVRGFYPSIVPAVMRHWVYTTTRVGLYEHLRSKDSNVLNKNISSTFTLNKAPFQKRIMQVGDVIHAAVDMQFIVGRIKNIEDSKLTVDWEVPLWTRKNFSPRIIITQLDAGPMRIIGTTVF